MGDDLGVCREDGRVAAEVDVLGPYRSFDVAAARSRSGRRRRVLDVAHRAVVRAKAVLIQAGQGARTWQGVDVTKAGPRRREAPAYLRLCA
ncbi:hypothetical protein [Streptomyces canus]|uniref:hypothetical protein n=2 Tax=Streptomyces canus TaxID=58343 RepID=UPI002E275A8C